MANERFYQGPYFDNLGISYNSGTGVFTVQGAMVQGLAGRSLSSENPAYVVLPSKSVPGLFKKYTVTEDQSFIDDNGASEIINNLFGLPTGVAYAEDIPFFIYAVGNDSENAIAFMISRVPHLRTSPAAANIGAPDDAVADAQGDFWSFDNLDETLYDNNPCLLIGSFRMQMSSSDDWTVQTLDNQDGTGMYQESRLFTFPTGVFGASSGTFFLPNGGTAPLFTTNTYFYTIQKNGYVLIKFFCNGDPGTDGAGAVSTEISLPYIADDALSQNTFIGYGRNIDITNGTSLALFQASNGNNYTFVVLEGGAFVQNGDYANGARTVDAQLYYRIDI